MPRRPLRVTPDSLIGKRIIGDPLHTEALEEEPLIGKRIDPKLCPPNLGQRDTANNPQE